MPTPLPEGSTISTVFKLLFTLFCLFVLLFDFIFFNLGIYFYGVTSYLVHFLI